MALYHDTYDLIRTGDLYRLVSPFDNAFRAVWQIVSEDKSRTMVTVVTMRMDYIPHTILRLRGLEPDRIYEDEQTGKRYSGALLMHAGLNLTYTANSDGASAVLLFRDGMEQPELLGRTVTDRDGMFLFGPLESGILYVVKVFKNGLQERNLELKSV